MQSRSRPASDNYRGGLPLEATNEVRGRARFPSTTIQSRSRPASDDCRGARWGPWVNSTCALLHSTLISRGARGRTRTRCQPPVATNEVRGRAQFPSTSLQSCSRPARQGRRGDQTLAARSYQQGARSSFLLQVPSHVAASQRSLQVSGGSPEVSGRGALLHSKGTSGVWRQELQTRCVAERDFLLQLRSHATTSQR